MSRAMFRYFDTHAHVNFHSFREDADAVIRRALNEGVRMNLVGSQIDTSKRAVEMSRQYEGVTAVVGLHPIHLVQMHVDEEEDSFETRAEVFDQVAYRALATSSPRVVGIGECGLDYYRLPDAAKAPDGNLVDREQIRSLQRGVFRQHVELARDLNLALVVHTRQGERMRDSVRTSSGPNAYEDVYAILKDCMTTNNRQQTTAQADDAVDRLRVVIHCFSGILEHAQAFLGLGCFLGFNGIITFKNADDLREVVRAVPCEQMVMETDCPYLAPTPFRGKRNEPLYVREVATKIAEIKGISEQEVARITTENALRVFEIH